MVSKILNHLKYPSTWIAGVAALSGVFGWVITPEFQQAIAQAGVALITLIAFFFSDSDVKD